MKKLFLTATILFALLLTPLTSFAQGMPVLSPSTLLGINSAEGMGNWTSSPSSATSDDHTAREEAEGKEIWEKLQSKQIECKNLTDEHYGALGEYFMGQSIGNTQRHALMNQMMTSMMGEDGEEQAHIAMGKRLSGCEPNAQVSSNGVGFMPMMWMMGSTGSPQVGGGGNPAPALSGVEGMGYGGWNNMMGGFGLLGWIPMLLFWILLILGAVALLRYLGGSARSGDKGRSPLDILKERYAKGEIDKKEFEQMKKDLS